jgi:hypothetical protein
VGKKTLPTLHFDWCITIKVGKKNLAHPTLKLLSVHPETPIKIPKLKLWTPNNGHLGIQSFSFGSVSGWTLSNYLSLYENLFREIRFAQ